MLRHPEGTRLLIKCPEKQTERPKEQYAPLAQLAEQLTFNQRVAGSSPARRTTPSQPDPQVQLPAGQKYTSAVKKYQVLKNQPATLGLAGFLFIFSGKLSLNTLPAASVRRFLLPAISVWAAADLPGEPSPGMAPSLLPEYGMEVAP